jgi:hypothetical protein
MSPDNLTDKQDHTQSSKDQLIQESATTVGGLQRDSDPRDAKMLEEEQRRLQKLALQALIDAKRRKEQ